MTNANIKAGDIVKVVDWGRAYSTSVDWLLDRRDKLRPEWLVRYAYGDSRNYEKYDEINSDNRQWKVLFVDGGRALITEHFSAFAFERPVYLINVDGLSCAREMTLSEIEAALGYPVKIVKER